MVAKHPGHRIGICPQSLRTHNRRAMPTDPPATASARLFLALWPPSEVLDAALRHAAQWSWAPRARPLPPAPPAPPSARLFLALWPPSEVLDAALRHAAQWSWPRGARRVRPDKV